MACLTILRYPDPRLRKKATAVAQVDDSIRRLVADMAETMYAAPGIGLSATQVDVHKRVIVVDISPTRNDLKVLINPEIASLDGVSGQDEGCLSVPGVFERVPRAERIRVRALNAEGLPFELDADGLLAVCIQHEIDHLEGKVFVDYLSRLKRTRIETRMRKLEREVG